MTLSDNRTIADIVDQTLIFRSLDTDIRHRLKSEARSCRFSAGEMIIREGDPGTEMMIITGGKVQVTQKTAGGDVPIAYLKDKAVIGEVSVITGTPRTCSVIAVEAVEVICFSKDTIQSIIQSSPRVKSLLLKLIESRALQSLEAGDTGDTGDARK